MSGNAAQQARRMLKPKSRGRPGASRAQSPSFTDSGNSIPQFAPQFAPPAAQSFSFDGAFKPAGVNNPFAGGFAQSSMESQSDASKRQMGEEADLSRKKPFGGFPTINTQGTSNMFGDQATSQRSPNTFNFGAPNGGSGFGNSQAQTKTPTFPFATTGTQAQSTSSMFGSSQAPSQAATTSFSFGQQPQSPASGSTNSIFGNGGSFGSTTTANTIAKTAADYSSVLSQPKPAGSPLFQFGQSAPSAASPTIAKAESFSFGQSATPAFSQPPASASFTFGTNSEPKPQSSTSSMFPGTPAPATGSLFGTNTTPAAASSPFKFGGDQSNNMFISASKASAPSTTGSSLFAQSTSQAASTTPAISSAPSTNLFGRFGTLSGGSVLNGDAENQTQKTFAFGEQAKSKDSDTSEKFPSQSLFGNVAEKPATSNLFGNPATSQTEPTSSRKNVFLFGKSSENSGDSNSAAPTQEKTGINGSTPLFGPTTSNQESGKDESGKSPFSFGLSPSQTPSQPTQPPQSTSLFGSSNPTTTQKESTTGSSSSEINGTPSKDLGSSPSKPSSSLFGNPPAATSSFAQKHKPVRPSPLSQSMTGVQSPDVGRSMGTSIFQGTSQMSGISNNPLPSIFESPSTAQSQAAKEDIEYKKEYDAAKRLRSLSHAVKDALNRMPVTADVSKLLVFYETRRQEILKDVVKSKRKAVDEGADEDGTGPSPSKKQRANNGKATAPSPPKFFSSGESFKENEDMQPAREESIFSSTPTKLPAKQQDKPVPATPRPAFDTILKPQSTIYGSTTPRGSPPKNVFAAEALKAPAPKTPAPNFTKDPPQTEKPKSTTSLFAMGTSTAPRNPPSKADFSQSSQLPQPSLFAAPSTNGSAKDLSPSKSRPITQTPLFGSVNSSFPAKQTEKKPAKAPFNSLQLGSTPFGQSNGFGSPASKESIQAPTSSLQPGSNIFGSSASKETAKAPSTLFQSGSNVFGSSASKEPPKAPSTSLQSGSNVFALSNGFGSSSSKKPAEAPSSLPTSGSNVFGLSNGFGSSSGKEPVMASSPSKQPATATTTDPSSQQSLFPSIPPAATASPAPSGKRKAATQLTKDDFEASEKAPSTPSGKRKAEEQLTKDDYESQNGINGNGQKTPKTNGRSETSLLFKNILDSPAGNATPPKPIFTLTKSDKSTPRPNPFVSLGISQTPKTSVSAFGSPVPKGNDAPTPVFGANVGSSASVSTSPSLFKKDLPSAVPSQSSSTNGFSFSSAPKPAVASTFAASSFTAAPKAPAFTASASTASSSGLSAVEKMKQETEAKALKDALETEYDSDDDGDKEEWIKKWKEARASKYKSDLKVPSFGVPAAAGASTLSVAEQFRKKAEDEALQRAIDEDYDSDDDKEEFIQKWKTERVAKTKALNSNKSVFIPGKGFSFSSQDSGSRDNSPDTTKPEDSSKSSTKSIFEQPAAPSTDVSRASSVGVTTSANGSVLNGRMAFPASNNIFGHLSDSGTDIGKDADDDESPDEGSDNGVRDDEKRDPTYDPTTEPEQSPDSPVEETGPGIASAKKQTSAFSVSPAPSSGTGTPKGSLFDRISKDSEGNVIREYPIENKENTQPTSKFNFFQSAPADKTWNQNTPIKFGASSAAPSVDLAAATSTPPKPFDFFAKAPATGPGNQSTPFKSGTSTAAPVLFGTTPAPVSASQKPFDVSQKAPSASLFKFDNPSAATKDGPVGGSDGPFKSPFAGFGSSKPAAVATGSSLFSGMTSQPASSFGNSGTATPAATSSSNLFGSTKPSSVFSGFGDTNKSPASVGFSFGAPSPAPSLFASAGVSASNSRASTPGATTDNDSNAATETSNEADAVTANDPDAEHHEQINLANSRAGQEDEDVLLECRAKGTQFIDEKWVPKGTGVFRVLRHKETGATRTLLRSDPSGNIIINKGLLGIFNYQATQKTVKLLTAGAGAKLETWLVQVKTPEKAQEMAEILEKNKPKSG